MFVISKVRYQPK
ncbi:hypothetical protein FOG18_06200 [Legionella israelensis]|nr:hypothetical protein FOG18_06200 [Legionella israelensis]